MALSKQEKTAIYARKHYNANKEQYKEGHRRRAARNKEYVDLIKRHTPCIDCNKHYPTVCMDFHHLDRESKVNEIGKMIWSHSIDRLQSEIDKCVVICANCHRIREWT